MNWISIKTAKPPNDCVCWVTNNKYFSQQTHEAIYHARQDVFVMYDPERHTHPCLEVTHYIVKPDVPRYEPDPFS